jgi:hypothetical protein
VFVAPGNAGTATEAKCENVAIDVLAIEQLADFAETERQLTIVGPEAPLVAGVVDLFRSARGLDCFGPTAGGSPAGRLQGIHQGLPRASQDPDRRLSELHRELSRPWLTCEKKVRRS